MHTPRFIAALSTSATAHRHHLLLGLLLAAVACGGRSTDDLLASAGGSASGGAGQGGGAGGAGPGGAAGAAAAGEAAAGAGGGTWYVGGSVGTGGFPNVGGAIAAGGSAGAAGSGAAGVGGFGGSGAGGQGGTSWTACGPADSCVLEPVSCCGPGCEPVPLSAFNAINSKSVLDYTNSHPICPCIYAPCQVVAPEQRNVPNYIATCEQGQCKAIDIRLSALTACTSSADCYLRSGTSCCAGCGTDNMVAFSNKANVQTTLCAGGPFSCPAILCTTPPPVGLSAVCNSSGHCVAYYPHVVDGGAAGSTATPGNEDDDCTTVPCASPLVCCPSTNTCTPNDFRICSSSVVVGCTKSTDCPAGQTCWVTAATTTGSGPSGSVCAATAPAGAQGVACNHGPIGGGIADCPLPSGQWTTCFPVAHSPAGLGVCIRPTF